MTRLKRLRAQLAMVLSVLVILCVGCHKKHESEHHKSASPTPSPIPTVQSATILERSLPVLVPLTGSVTANDPVTVSARIDGRVEEVTVDVGDMVRKGQVLVTIDDTDARLQLLEDEAQLKQSLAALGLTSPGQKLTDKTKVPGVQKALAVLENQKENYDRYQDLRRQELVSDQEVSNARQSYRTAQSDYDSAVQQVDQDQAAVAINEAKIEKDRQQLTYYTLVSPIDGQVQEKKVSRGDLATNGSPALVLVDVEDLFISLAVPQVHVPQVGVGRILDAQAETVPPILFKAVVEEVDPILDITTRSLTVKARVLSRTPGLKPGMFANVILHTGESQKHLLAPQSGVLTESGISRVFTLHRQGSGWEVKSLQVRTSDTVDDWIEVEGDLKAGTLVVASNLAALKDGQQVEVKGEVAPPKSLP